MARGSREEREWQIYRTSETNGLCRKKRIRERLRKRCKIKQKRQQTESALVVSRNRGRRSGRATETVIRGEREQEDSEGETDWR